MVEETQDFIARNKVSLSFLSIFVMVAWVWGTATYVADKEDRLTHRIDMQEYQIAACQEKLGTFKMDIESRMDDLRAHTRNSEVVHGELKNDARMLRRDIQYIRNSNEKLWDRYDTATGKGEFNRDMLQFDHTDEDD